MEECYKPLEKLKKSQQVTTRVSIVLAVVFYPRKETVATEIGRLVEGQRDGVDLEYVTGAQAIFTSWF